MAVSSRLVLLNLTVKVARAHLAKAWAKQFSGVSELEVVVELVTEIWPQLSIFGMAPVDAVEVFEVEKFPKLQPVNSISKGKVRAKRFSIEATLR